MESDQGRERAFEIDTEARVLLIAQMDVDSKLLMKNQLIDYSVLFLQVGRERVGEKKTKEEPLLRFDAESGLFRVTMHEVAQDALLRS